MIRSLSATLALGLALCAGPSRAAAPAPLLRIDAGEHTEPVLALAADAAGRYLLSAAGDRTVRVWNVQAGLCERVLRPPQDRPGAGEIAALALSPNGRIAAIASSTDDPAAVSLFLMEWRGGEHLHHERLPRLSSAQLAFSTDGRQFALALPGALSLRAADTGKEVARDETCAATALAAGGGGRLLAACQDGLRLYGPGLRAPVPVGPSLPADAGAVHTLAFSPDGERVALALGRGAVLLLSGAGLNASFSLLPADPRGPGAVPLAFSAAGLYLGGRSGALRSSAGAGVRRLPIGPVDALAPLPRGAAYASGRRVLVLDGDASRPLAPPALVAHGPELTTDHTGSVVRFSYAPSAKAVYSVAQHRVFLERDPDPRLRPAEPAPWPVLRAAGRALEICQEDAPCRAVTLPAEARAVTGSGDGKLALVALSDGTIRWYGTADGRELLGFLPHADRIGWIAFTPGSYLDGPRGMAGLLGWHLERGPDQLADFFRLSLLQQQLHQPAVIERVLLTLDEERAAASVYPRPALQGERRRLLPPVVRVLSPGDADVVRQGAVRLRVHVRSPSGLPVTVRVRTDGQTTLFRGVQTFSVGDAEGIHELPVELPPRAHITLTLLGETEASVGEPVVLNLRWAGALPRDAPVGDLWLLAVGVSRYRDRGYNLEYPAQDARAIERAWKEQEGRLYRRVTSRLLVDQGATREAVVEGLRWLRQRTGPDDVAVLFLAGHGESDASGVYQFLPHDMDRRDPRTLLSALALQRHLAGMDGRVLLFLDTCHAGSVRAAQARERAPDLERLTEDLANIRSGVVVYAASAATQAAREHGAWKGGAFTRAVVEGLRGGADVLRAGRITVSGLDVYVSRRVRDLTHEAQTPTTAKPSTVPDFVIARVRAPWARDPRFWLGVGLAGAASAALGVGLGLGLRQQGMLLEFPISF